MRIKCVQNYRPCYYIILLDVESINIYLDKLYICLYIYTSLEAKIDAL